MSNRLGLAKFIARRLFYGVFTLFIVSVFIFAATQALPSDAAQTVLGRNATPASLKHLREGGGVPEIIVVDGNRLKARALTVGVAHKVIREAHKIGRACDRVRVKTGNDYILKRNFLFL